ncbi:hypothetical protein [Nonomuraea ceibae]|uniref:hypothetical protein n=1 Tax=Nonomuraea ceibae TaxID=1935170 RepID=UPI001C5CD82A|nr:hypothetical protein [Nonomuraea ceibae]
MEGIPLTERIWRAKHALDQAPGFGEEDTRQKITELIVDLMAYAHSLHGQWRNPIETGQILARVTAATAEIGQANNTTGWHYKAPGFVEEAAWLVGELMAEADEFAADAGRPPSALKLLAHALLDYQANRPRHHHLGNNDFEEPWGRVHDLRNLLDKLRCLVGKLVQEHPDAAIEVLSEVLGVYTRQ